LVVVAVLEGQTPYIEGRLFRDKSDCDTLLAQRLEEATSMQEQGIKVAVTDCLPITIPIELDPGTDAKNKP